MCENNSTNKSIRTVEMLPTIIDGREYVLRVIKDENGKVIKGELCLPIMGGLAMLLEGDE